MTAQAVAGPPAVGTLFRPASRCGAACLSPTAERTARTRQLVRLAATAGVLAAASVAATAIRVLPPARRSRAAATLLRRTSGRLLAALGVRCVRTGSAPPARRALLVANHISWLDILGLLAVGDVRIVAKSEVAAWPVIGRLARLCGTIFVDRDRPRTLVGTVAEIREALAAGHLVAAFAEGTTTCGSHPVPYRPAVFQAAIDANACVVPVTLRYRAADGTPTSRPAFIGDETLLASLRRVLGMPALHLDVRLHTRLYPDAGAARAALSRLAETGAAHPVRWPAWRPAAHGSAGHGRFGRPGDAAAAVPAIPTPAAASA